jgi:hypothetical protein
MRSSIKEKPTINEVKAKIKRNKLGSKEKQVNRPVTTFVDTKGDTVSQKLSMPRKKMVGITSKQVVDTSPPNSTFAQGQGLFMSMIVVSKNLTY